jgi:hypothetical protein
MAGKIVIVKGSPRQNGNSSENTSIGGGIPMPRLRTPAPQPPRPARRSRGGLRAAWLPGAGGDA